MVDGLAFKKSMMNRTVLLLGIFLGALVQANAQTNPKPEENFTQFVNPFIGTGGHGHTFPGPTLPFGMMQLSPDTRLTGWDGCGGYHYSDDIVYGFSHTHLSGTGVSDYGDVLLKPCVGQWHIKNGHGQENPLIDSYASKFSKETEIAQAGYYKVSLEEGIDVELTTTLRAGMHRYTFENPTDAHVILDLTHRDQLVDADLTVVNDFLITGYRRSNAWANDQHIYFAIEFDKPISKSQVTNVPLTGGSNSNEVNAKAVYHFTLKDEPILQVRVGISAVDVEGALNNLRTEIPHWEFDKVRAEANQSWNQAMQKIAIKDSEREDDKTVFYSALYHSMIAPNIYSDIDGRYRKMSPIAETESSKRGTIGQLDKTENHYTVFSLWDTFRATHPLYTIIEQERTADFIRTFLRQYQDGGQLPVWELASTYTGCMIGYHSVSVINDAHQLGIRGFDEKLALEAMLQSAERNVLGLEDYRQTGCLNTGNESESVSKTLEYAYDDWCIAQYAKRIGQPEIAQEYLQRAQYYKNLYNPSNRFVQARRNGGWYSPFEPGEVNFNYTEANGWQYSLFAPHDVNGLMELMGGEEAFANHLDAMFETSSETSGRHQVDITGLIGQYAQGNEPSHHVAYLYNYAGQAWKTQAYTSAIMDTLYRNAPDGLSGNEDCGQMSSWYVLSAIGFYPVCPGDGQYVFGSPQFEDLTINLENGNSFHVKTKGLALGPYIQSVLLNGEQYDKSFIKHEDILQGGTIEFTMGDKPNYSFGTNMESRPTRQIKESLIAINPSINAEDRIFDEQLTVKLNSPQENAKLYYTIDGQHPSEKSIPYKEPFQLYSTGIVKAIAIFNGQESKVVSANFYKIDRTRKITINSPYAPQYAAGGDQALIDMVKGSEAFTTGDWQGFREDLDIVIDLGKKTEIEKIRLGCNQNIRSWIWFPTEVEFAVSNKPDSTFKTVTTISNDFPDNKEGAFIKHFEASFKEKARYVRVRAKQYGECPDWHLGAGGKTWIFVDEIEIE